MYGGTGSSGRADEWVLEEWSVLPSRAIKLIYGDEDTEIGGSARRLQGFLLLPLYRILFPPLLHGKKGKSGAP